ncbi:MAG: hypothetical protein NVSMB62_11260 [Acidobacteriaceae bacterium]
MQIFEAELAGGVEPAHHVELEIVTTGAAVKQQREDWNEREERYDREVESAGVPGWGHGGRVSQSRPHAANG